MAAKIPVIAKLKTNLRSKYVKTSEILHSVAKELEVIAIRALISLIFCGHNPDFKNFSILATNNNECKVKVRLSPFKKNVLFASLKAL